VAHDVPVCYWLRRQQITIAQELPVLQLQVYYRRKAALVFVLAAVDVLGCQAQSVNGRSLLAQCSSAMNSDRAVRGLYAEGTVISAAHGDQAVRLTIKTSDSNQLHQEEEYSSGPQVSNVSRGKGSSSLRGEKKELPTHAVAFFQPDHIPALACRLGSINSEFDVEYVGLEKLGERAVHHLKLTARPKGKNARLDQVNTLISERHVFVDAANGLVASIRYWVFAPNALENHSNWQVFYSDYRPVDGVMMPFHMETHVDGNKFREVTFTSFRTDLTVTDADFQ
jgi:hypothetical protein